VDKSTRNDIQRATQAARTLLEETFAAQLEGTYDIQLDGTISEQPGGHLSERQKVTREKLIAAVAHKKTSGLTPSEAVQAYLREAAFTTLNRFVALKMLEARQLVQECVSKGEDSNGFKEFTALAPGLVAIEDKGYRLYIDTIFDELGQEVKVLFDRRDVASLLWPDRQTLLELLGTLNAPELAGVWAEDETIGWVYQYFNGDEERSKMRAESDAPRNSRELAVRNQFFTPRYVVEFLTDNTLGRIWYEMMQGETELAQLKYLVRRPNEVLLPEGVSAPESEEDDSELSQQELLRQTVHLPFRAKKDPRDLRILDPACGSGHFLLYTFDLLITIYEEAWGDSGAADFTETGTQLRADYGSIDELRRAMPELILRYNLHGVDIDPRAAQIAALALWIRAQRAYNLFEVDPAQRPPITKTNIVVAEPMPGDAELVDEFAASLNPPVLGDLFKKMVEEMKLAGELGSLLKIEESIAKAVKESAEAHRQGSLFAGELESRDFWDTADEKIIAALASFAESAAGSAGIRRRLFAGDAAQGVAFIELMRKRFDTVLMNPPFGYTTSSSKLSCDSNYPLSKADILAMFVDMALIRMAPGGLLGAITSRTVFFIEFFRKWREQLLKNVSVSVFADLGLGILDAMVETAAFVLARPQGSLDPQMSSVFIRLLSERRKQDSLELSIDKLRSDSSSKDVFAVHQAGFSVVEGSPFAYWVPASFRNHFVKHNDLSECLGGVKVGLQSGDDFRFFRTSWEVEENDATNTTWPRIAKGGEYRPFYDDIHLRVKWPQDGHEIKNFFGASGRLRSRPQNTKYYFRPGITYPMRTRSSLSPRVMAPGCIFNVQGNTIFADEDCEETLFFALGVLTSRVFAAFTRLKARIGDMSTAGGAGFAYTPGLVGSMPFPRASAPRRKELSAIVRKCVLIESQYDQVRETSSLFCRPFLSRGIQNGSSVRESLRLSYRETIEMEAQKLSLESEIETIVEELYRLNRSDQMVLDAQFGKLLSELPPGDSLMAERLKALVKHGGSAAADCSSGASQTKKVAGNRRLSLREMCYAVGASPVSVSRAIIQHGWLPADLLEDEVTRLLNYLVGVCFGRWDISSAFQDPRSEDSWRPFRPLPDFPPAMSSDAGQGRSVLVDDHGHEDDILANLTRQIEIIGDINAQQLHLEILECPPIVGTTLRLWLSKNLYARHLSIYSKSRRRAPIYWQLATPSASYSVWCYYHRLTHDTFFRVANDYVAPKVDHEERKLNTLRQEAGLDPSSKQRKEIDAQEGFVAELRAFLTEVERIAPLWSPNLNDGVIINFAPLWRLVPQHKAWQKECKKVWDTLCKGDYDWAHLAMHLWPERVVPKCQYDRSLAIAHGLEDDLWYEDDEGQKTVWKKRQVSSDRVVELVATRSSTAVKAALQDLLEAPAPSGTARRKRSANA